VDSKLEKSWAITSRSIFVRRPNALARLEGNSGMLLTLCIRNLRHLCLHGSSISSTLERRPFIYVCARMASLNDQLRTHNAGIPWSYIKHLQSLWRPHFRANSTWNEFVDSGLSTLPSCSQFPRLSLSRLRHSAPSLLQFRMSSGPSRRALCKP